MHLQLATVWLAALSSEFIHILASSDLNKYYTNLDELVALLSPTGKSPTSGLQETTMPVSYNKTLWFTTTRSEHEGGMFLREKVIRHNE